MIDATDPPRAPRIDAQPAESDAGTMTPADPLPEALKNVRVRVTDDGRRVITNQDAADTLETTTDNLRQMIRAGKLTREMDLDEAKRSWYRVDIISRAYWDKFPERKDEAEPNTPETPSRESETVTHEMALIVSELSQTLKPIAQAFTANEESKDATIDRLTRMLGDAIARADRMERERDEALRWREKTWWERVNRR